MVGFETSKRMVERACSDCSLTFSYEGEFWDRMEFTRDRVCDACEKVRKERHAAEMERHAAEKVDIEHRKQALLWEEICPPLYRETEASKLKLTPAILRQVLGWNPNPIGIGLTGESGTGKTRAMYMLLKKLFSDGIRVRAISGKRFEKYCHRMFEKTDDAAEAIEYLHSTPILFIDDIGKEKYTERVETEFYDLIESRTSHLLPILWTSNSTGEQLTAMLGEGRGSPIVRRLREFSTVYSV